MLRRMLATATATRLRRIFGSTICHQYLTKYRILTDHTALPVHFDQECRHCHLASRNSQIEEEYGDPSEKKEIAQFVRLVNHSHMVSETMIDGKDTEDLSKNSKQLPTQCQ